MRIVLGIAPEDRADDATAAESLLLRLQFPDSSVDLVDVVPENAALGMAAGVFGDVWTDLQRRIRRDAQDRLGEAAARLAGQYATTTAVLSGHPASRLLAHADEAGADLIAVNGSTKQPPVFGALIGSVARTLAVDARQSLLIARGSVPADPPPIRAVLATDHSAYLERCLTRFIAFAPAGIGELTVLTVLAEAPDGEEARTTSRREIVRRCEMVVARLQQHAGFAETALRLRVAEGRPQEAITGVMEESDAELLIVGAQGHGFFERLTLGSVSFDQAVHAYPWSVLVLRSSAT